jgi:hypothetical protein
MKKVNKNTRAGKNGKIIQYPYCKTPTTVYHFSWCAITCSGCNKMVDKAEWFYQRIKTIS